MIKQISYRRTLAFCGVFLLSVPVVSHDKHQSHGVFRWFNGIASDYHYSINAIGVAAQVAGTMMLGYHGVKFLNRVSDAFVKRLQAQTAFEAHARAREEQRMGEYQLQSQAMVASTEGQRITFDDIAGFDGIMDEVRDLVDSIKYAHLYDRMGAATPRGILLTGEPGNGKTYLARAIAGEAGCTFLYVSGSAFDQELIGVGANRMRKLFEYAYQHAPAIIFIDEIDAFGEKRDNDYGRYQQTLNQLLVLMDGFNSNSSSGKVVVIGATNRPDVLDPALVRPGRFDRKIVVPYPGLKARKAMLLKHASKRRCASDINMDLLAAMSDGFSAATLANIVNRAAILATRKRKLEVQMEDFEQAWEEEVMGMAAKEVEMSPEERLEAAYHESGHALVRLLHPVTAKTPLYKITVNPIGNALGVTYFFSAMRNSTSKEQFFAEIMCCLGGRVAEEIVFGAARINTGAYSDFDKATSLARRMVASYGMVDGFGGVVYSDYRHALSPEMASRIDHAVETIMIECLAATKELLLENRDKLELLAQALNVRGDMKAHDIAQVLGIEVVGQDSFVEKSGSVD